jgi:hypothetical protein
MHRSCNRDLVKSVPLPFPERVASPGALGFAPKRRQCQVGSPGGARVHETRARFTGLGVPPGLVFGARYTYPQHTHMPYQNTKEPST